MFYFHSFLLIDGVPQMELTEFQLLTHLGVKHSNTYLSMSDITVNRKVVRKILTIVYSLRNAEGNTLITFN